MLTLRDLCELHNRWIVSKAKKDNVDEAVSKYDGELPPDTAHTVVALAFASAVVILTDE